MKERGILFSGEMVRAILERRKTQTRRVIKNPGRLNGLMLSGEEGNWCPYGRAGDRLWVRETCVRFTGIPVNRKPWPLAPEWRLSPDGDPYKSLLPKVYDNFVAQLDAAAACVSVPSIHMPRWASRITLEVIGVRVERLRDITEEDAKAEGIDLKHFNSMHSLSDKPYAHCFEWLWNSINAKHGYGWDVNPYVWVVEFKPLEVKG